MKAHDYVQWSSTDEQGKFTMTAQVVSINAKTVTMIAPGVGEMTVPVDDGSFKVIKKPAKFNQIIQTAPVEQEPVEVERPANNRRKGEGKDKAIELYNSMKANGEHPVRKDVIEAFVDILGFTPAHASTYQNKCKSEWCK